jgi:hypothetical protein
MTAIGWRAATAGVTGRPVRGAATRTGVGSGVLVGEGDDDDDGLGAGAFDPDGFSLGRGLGPATSGAVPRGVALGDPRFAVTSPNAAPPMRAITASNAAAGALIGN